MPSASAYSGSSLHWSPGAAENSARSASLRSVPVKRSSAAMFVLKREGGVWRISVMRIAGWRR